MEQALVLEDEHTACLGIDIDPPLLIPGQERRCAAHELLTGATGSFCRVVQIQLQRVVRLELGLADIIVVRTIAVRYSSVSQKKQKKNMMLSDQEEGQTPYLRLKYCPFS